MSASFLEVLVAVKACACGGESYDIAADCTFSCRFNCFFHGIYTDNAAVFFGVILVALYGSFDLVGGCSQQDKCLNVLVDRLCKQVVVQLFVGAACNNDKLLAERIKSRIYRNRTCCEAGMLILYAVKRAGKFYSVLNAAEAVCSFKHHLRRYFSVKSGDSGKIIFNVVHSRNAYFVLMEKALGLSLVREAEIAIAVEICSSFGDGSAAEFIKIASDF